ncbi:MAG: 3'-5' exonuclease [Candidatus Caldarchaeum sp.]
MLDRLLSQLSPAQKEAVTHGEGPAIVLAGAGSGKTRVLTHRIAYLVSARGVPPSHILAVTFTNKAAGEMRERALALLDGSPKGLWVGTFHSICLRILRREIEALGGFKRSFVVYDEGDQLALIRDCIRELGLNDNVYEPRALRARIDGAKGAGIYPEEMADEASGDVYLRQAVRVYGLYQKRIRDFGALDFGDLMALTVRLFESRDDVLKTYQEKFAYILIDEYQDTNPIQYRLAKLLASSHRNLFVVGDDNQSIYGWRGADISNILEFERDWRDAKVIKLEENYRSTKTILRAANAVIANNKKRREKTLWTRNKSGAPILYYEASSERDEARWVAEKIAELLRSESRGYGDFAVFYRTNNQSRAFEEEMMRTAIPYVVLGSLAFYQRAEVKDALSYLRLIVNPTDDLSLKRIINTPARGIGKATVAALEGVAREKGSSMFDAIDAMEGKAPRKSVKALKELKNTIESLKEFCRKAGTKEAVEKVLMETGFIKSLEGNEDKLSNIGEIINRASEFENTGGAGLADFLADVSLATDIDQFREGQAVALMTIHSAKGLEFPVVFITGMEQNLFPHSRSLGWEQLEEERRLFYVGLTRAKERVFLSGSSRRMLYGEEKRSAPSIFLEEIPDECIIRTSHLHKEPAHDAIPTRKAEPPLPQPAFKPGDKVMHPAFGTGVVKGREGSGTSLTLSIFFPKWGIKRILSSFPGLKKA